MLQPLNHQSIQQTSLNKGQLARAHIAASPTLYQTSPHFGNRFHALSRSIFQPVAESYLIGFTVQDVFGLWFPRIWNSLERGRIHYNPKHDPDAAKRSAASPMDQKRYALQQNLKGLNWWNGFEETAREVQSGPGYLLVQSIFVAAATAWCLGGRSLMMSVKNLDTYTSHLNHVLQTMGTPKSSTQIVSKLVHQMTGNLEGDRVSKLAISPNMSRAERQMLTKSEQHLQQWLGTHFKNNAGVTFADAFKQWKKQYLQVLNAKSGLAKKSSALNPIEKVFEELVVQWNGTVKGVTNPTKMTLFELPKVASAIPGKVLQSSMDAHQFLLNMEKFSTTIPAVLKNLAGNKPVMTVLNTLRNSSVTNKFWVCVIATLLGGLNHFYVSAVAQSVKRKYPANRLIPLPQSSVRHVSETTGGATLA